MSMYDSYGMMAHLMIIGNGLMQDIWRTGITSKDLIDENI